MAKKALFLTLAVVSLAAFASILFLAQFTRTRSAERQTANALRAAEDARSAQEQQAAQTAQAEREREQLARQNQELTQLATSLRAKATTPTNLPAPSASAGQGSQTKNSDARGDAGGMAAMMRKMMDDPAMREMIRSQQKTAISQMYASLFKELQLPPEQREKFLTLLVDNAMSSVAQAGDVLQGEGAGRTDALNSIQARQEQMNQGLKELLGPEQYARYEEYQKTLAERTQLNTFRQQLAETETPLQDAQATQLMAILTEEKARVPAVLGGGAGAVGANLGALGSPETMNQHFQWQADVNRRVLERTLETLNPKQQSAYAAFLRQQLDMQKAGIKMAQDLFGTPRSGSESAPPPGVEVVPVPSKP